MAYPIIFTKKPHFSKKQTPCHYEWSIRKIAYLFVFTRYYRKKSILGGNYCGKRNNVMFHIVSFCFWNMQRNQQLILPQEHQSRLARIHNMHRLNSCYYILLLLGIFRFVAYFKTIAGSIRHLTARNRCSRPVPVRNITERFGTQLKLPLLYFRGRTVNLPFSHGDYHQPLVAMIFLIIASFFFSTINIFFA
jgi:hypothetical protein